MQVPDFRIHIALMGYHPAVDFILNEIVLICAFLELIDSKFDAILSVVDSISHLRTIFKELLIELLISKVTENQ